MDKDLKRVALLQSPGHLIFGCGLLHKQRDQRKNQNIIKRWKPLGQNVARRDMGPEVSCRKLDEIDVSKALTGRLCGWCAFENHMEVCNLTSSSYEACFVRKGDFFKIHEIHGNRRKKYLPWSF